MKRVAIIVLIASFIILSQVKLGLSGNDKHTEDKLVERGFLTQEEYEAAKKHRIQLSQEQYQKVQSQQPKTASCETGPEVTKDLTRKHAAEFGFEVSYRTYEEPDVMEEKGIMYGMFGSYAYRDNFMLRGEGLYSFGEVDYKNSGTMDNIDDYVLEFRGLGGYDFPVSDDKIITPYLGIGYRYLNDEFGPGKYTSTGSAGYERESTYFYSPIGVEGMYNPEHGWSVGISLEYDYFWEGTQKSRLGWVPGFYDIENDQEDGYGLRGSIEFKKKGENVDYIIEPFIRYWNIDDSEITTDPVGRQWTEPENNTEEYGIKISIQH